MREFRCFGCGKIERYEVLAEPRCCGMAMRPGELDSPSGKNFRIDLVRRGRRDEHGRWTADPPPHGHWLEWFEVWFLWPGRDTKESQQIGVLGLAGIGTWEFDMTPGYPVSEGAAFSRTLAIEKMVTIAGGDLG